MPAVAAGIRPAITATCTLPTWRSASADSRPNPTPTVATTISIRPSTSRGGSSGERRTASAMIAGITATTDRPTPTASGLNETSAAAVAGKVRLKHTTPSAPRMNALAFLDGAFVLASEVLLLSLMNDGSNSLAVSAVRAKVGLEQLVQALPPDSRLPSYRQLQQRYRLSPATVQRMLADLARRGLVVTRPGSGTYTAPRRLATAPADVSWQTLALGSRASLGADLEQMIQPGPLDSISMSSG